jgi:stage IV sporulation protein FB
VLNINRSVFLFNILPLYPLDGGRIVQSLRHCWLPYKTAQSLTFVVSAILTPIVFVQWMNRNPMTLGVFGFLFFVNVLSWRQRTYQAEQFYLYRLIHPRRLPLKLHRHQDLYRQRHNVILEQDGLIDEKQWLMWRFGKTRPIRSKPRDWLI